MRLSAKYRHPLTTQQIHPVFSILYLVAAAAIFLQSPRSLVALRQGVRVEVSEAGSVTAAGDDDDASADALAQAASHILKTEHCGKRQWRLRAVA